MAAPLEFILFDEETGKLKVGDAAKAALRKIRGPLGVMSVCGRARTGKSFILNQLLGQSAGFTVASSYRPCTKGLWLWSEPVKRVGPDGSEYHLVLLDSEGIDAYNQTAQDGIQIFSLAVLLSSLFVYNQMGGIDEAALDRLSLVTEITKHIRIRASSAPGMEDQRELGEFTPSFLWLLRDFYFDLEEDGRKVSAREYLETALMPASGSGAAIEAKNQIRNSIKSLFPDRDCFTLVRPVHEERNLRRLDRVPLEEMREEFQQDVQRLTSLIFSRTSPKRVGTQIVTGPMLAGLAEAYVAAINEGAVPTIATAWQGVAEAECRHAMMAAEDRYREVFDEDIQAEELTLEHEHQKSLQAALRTFRELAVGDKKLKHRYKEELRETCSTKFNMIRTRKLAEASSQVDSMLYRYSSHLSNVGHSCTSYQTITEEMDRMVEGYLKVASGPTKWPQLVRFVCDHYASMGHDCVARLQDQAHSKVKESEEECSRVRGDYKAAEGRATKAEMQVGDLQRQLQVLQEQKARPKEKKSKTSCLACFNG